MAHTIIGSGVYNYDVINKCEYPNGFVVGKRNKSVIQHVASEVGGTCGNVMCILANMGWDAFPQAQLDVSEQGYQIAEDLDDYGCDTRFVENIPNGGTTICECTHKLDNKKGEHKMSVRCFNGKGSPFVSRKQLRARDEVPMFLNRLDFVPDFYFFDQAEAGPRAIADALSSKGTLIYFEPENDRDTRKFLSAVEQSDIIKFSGERIPDVSFTDQFSGRLFIQTKGAEGIQFRLSTGEWQLVPPVPVDNVVDWEGAGDWTTAAFINAIANRDIHRINQLNHKIICECLAEAQVIAAKSIGYMTPKGMINQ